MKNDIIVFVCGDFYAQNTCGLSINCNLLEKINNADIKIVNFEGPIYDRGAERIPKSGPSIAQDPKAPEFLEKAGFNVILLGNNHFMDFGKQAAIATFSSFKKSILVGAGYSIDAYKIKTIQINDKCVGFLSLTQHEFGVIENKNDDEAFGTAWISHQSIRDIIEQGKSGIDYLFVFPHAGIEHIDAPLPEWRNLYKSFIDWGADCIVASHPHVPQGWEMYKGCPIFYSLGNFYFDTITGGPWWNKGLSLIITLGDSIMVEPINTVFSNSSIGIDIGKETESHNEYLLSLINDDYAYEKYINEISKSAYDSYTYNMLRNSFDINPIKVLKAFVSVLLRRGNKNSILNYFQCESHRWMFERSIKQKFYK